MTIEKEELVTESYRAVIQEAALNELFGFFRNKAKQFSNQAQNAAYRVEPIRSANSVKVYRNAKLFPGEVYVDHTRLPKQKWSLFRGKSPVPTRGGKFIKSFNLIFILGYELDVTTNFFYEIWYDSYSSSYVILDKYAIPVSAKFPNLDACIADFVNIIAKEPAHVMFGDLSSNERDILKKLARRGKFSDKANEQEQTTEKILVEQLLEATAVTRQMLTQMVNNNVTEYYTTKMDRVAVKRFWQFWGKYVQIPQKYISRGFMGAVQKFVGREKTATFIIGFSLKNLIFIEIWYVKSNSTGIGSYFVFDLTSGEIVAQNLRTVRQAYTEAGKKLLVPTQFLGKIE